MNAAKLGRHLIVDAWDCPPALLDDERLIRRALIDAVAAGGASLIELCVHKFSPHGVTATATLSESHIAIHTWPEHGYFAADLFLCGRGEPKAALWSLLGTLRAGGHRVTELERGIGGRSRRARSAA
jgi:S-adenosylmethionine decarboxylase